VQDGGARTRSCRSIVHSQWDRRPQALVLCSWVDRCVRKTLPKYCAGDHGTSQGVNDAVTGATGDGHAWTAATPPFRHSDRLLGTAAGIMSIPPVYEDQEKSIQGRCGRFGPRKDAVRNGEGSTRGAWGDARTMCRSCLLAMVWANQASVPGSLTSPTMRKPLATSHAMVIAGRASREVHGVLLGASRLYMS
jgi:hypothetical protein